MNLSADIVRNILSDYIEYDDLLGLLLHIPYLYLSPKRIKVISSNDTKKTFIDNDLRKEEYYNSYNIKFGENNYKDGLSDGT